MLQIKDLDLQNSTIEIFDQEGRMLESLLGATISYPRPAGHQCSFIAIYINGVLANYDRFSNGVAHNIYPGNNPSVN